MSLETVVQIIKEVVFCATILGQPTVACLPDSHPAAQLFSVPCDSLFLGKGWYAGVWRKQPVCWQSSRNGVNVAVLPDVARGQTLPVIEYGIPVSRKQKQCASNHCNAQQDVQTGAIVDRNQYRLLKDR